MPPPLIFATNNQNKVHEIRSVLGNSFQILPLNEAGINIDIAEPHNTLEENAREKASVIHKLTGRNCFSEDTGLEVNALNGEPGVRSARYAGDEADFKKNILKLLKSLYGIQDRTAQFRTVISLIIDNKEFQFEGICKGYITAEEAGNKGFGYDSVFIPVGSAKTFADMDMVEKNIYSHRKKATKKFINFLKEYYGQN